MRPIVDVNGKKGPWSMLTLRRNFMRLPFTACTDYLITLLVCG